jgi:hypothetical protein
VKPEGSARQHGDQAQGRRRSPSLLTQDQAQGHPALEIDDRGFIPEFSVFATNLF